MAIDSHMHINHLVYSNPIDEIQQINKNIQIEKVINVGLDYQTSKEAVSIASLNQKFFSSVGVHPLYVDKQNLEYLYTLASHDKVVAIGEIGLDNSKDNILWQKIYFIEQIMIANDLGLPVIIHSNNMNKEIFEVFEKHIKPLYGCVFHCFQPDIEDLKYIIDHGYYISFAGKITYQNAKKSIEVARMVPDNLFLVETDSPYIPIGPFKEKNNHTSLIHYIISKLSEVKEKSYEEIEQLTTNNTKKLFQKMK